MKRSVTKKRAVAKTRAKSAAIAKSGQIDVSSLSSALVACRDVDVVREIRDKAIGIESYMRARGVGVDGLADAAEVVVRAERRLGELLVETPKHPGTRKSPGGASEEPPEVPRKLEELGVTKKQSKRWQDLAEIPPEDFEMAIRETRAKQQRLTAASLLRATKGDEDDHPGTSWLEEVLHEQGWILTAVQRSTVLARWSEAGEDAAYAVLKAIAWSQWDTREELAQLMVELADLQSDEHVLEPSAGEGAIVRAIHAAAPEATITACEIDPDRYAVLRELVADDILDNLLDGDFLTRDIANAVDRRIDVAIQNTPYENGTDGHFLERSMQLAGRVVALLRTNALHGSERFERVWKRCKPGGDWGVHDIIYLASRPDFDSVIADGTARSDFVVVRLDRGFSGETRVDWR